NDHDTSAAPWVAIINETAARRFWPGQDPIGKRFRLDTAPEEHLREVVGLAPDIPTRGRQTAADAVIYLPYLQHPLRSGPSGNMFGVMTFVLRSPGDPMSLVPALRQAVAEIEPDRPLANITPMKGIAVAFLGDLSRYVLVLGAFALVAT